MGQPKLLLDLAGRTVIARVIEALRNSGVSRCLVVVRRDDSDLIREVMAAGGEVVLPETDPADMRASVEWGLKGISPALLTTSNSRFSTPCDGWLLVPADHPTLNPQLVCDLIAAWRTSPTQIAVPVFEGQRGHPTIFPWSLAEEVFRLSPQQGLNSVLRSDPERIHEVPVADPRVLDDLDTPEDLLRLRSELESRPVG